MMIEVLVIIMSSCCLSDCLLCVPAYLLSLQPLIHSRQIAKPFASRVRKNLLNHSSRGQERKRDGDRLLVAGLIKLTYHVTQKVADGMRALLPLFFCSISLDPLSLSSRKGFRVIVSESPSFSLLLTLAAALSRSSSRPAGKRGSVSGTSND